MIKSKSNGQTERTTKNENNKARHVKTAVKDIFLSGTKMLILIHYEPQTLLEALRSLTKHDINRVSTVSS